MSKPEPGITQQSTRPRPIRKQAREQAASLSTIVDPDLAAPATPTPTAAATTPPATAGKTRRLAAATTKKVPKQPLSTQIEQGTGKRLDYLLRSNSAYKLTDVVGDALDALLDELDVPAADELD